MEKIAKRKLSQYYRLHSNKYELDDITFNDLNLDNYFELINKTSSSLGEEILYGILHQPLLDEVELKSRILEIDKYINNEELADDSKRKLKNLSKIKRISVFEYLNKFDEINILSAVKLYKAVILILFAIILLFVDSVIGIIALTVIFFYNSIDYFKRRDEIKPYFVCLSYILKAISVGEKLKDIDHSKYNKVLSLKKGAFLIGTIQGETVSGDTGSPLDIIIDFFKMGFHFDIIVFYRKVTKIKDYISDIDAFLCDVGYIDAYISISEIKKENKEICIPEFSVTNNSLNAKDLYHPLINGCKKNDIIVNKSVLLTGSNASGKSTFLRTVMLNVVLSQTLGFVYGAYYNAPMVFPMSSMSLTDDLLGGESFYMAEIKALKRIIDVLDTEDVKIICAVDEVLKGTNTKERILASSKILKYLSERCLCFAATHDLELTNILSDEFENYHFSEEIINDDIFFNYKLKEGATNTSNAIALLKTLGYPMF